jgi:hypothetical protein
MLGSWFVETTRMLGSWFVLTMEGTRLAMEAQQVIALRLMKIAAGGAGAQREVARTEKAVAATEGAATLATGGSRRKVVRRYRTHIRPNKRRLSKPPRRS